MQERRAGWQDVLPEWQTTLVADDLEAVLGAVGPRLRELRRRRAITLADLAGQTGISVSTLSRLEGGQRRPALELLLPLASTVGVAACRGSLSSATALSILSRCSATP